MVETSRPWSGIVLGDSGPYSDDEWADSWLSLIAPTIASEGVFKDQLNEFDISGATSPVSIASGRALVDGTWYETDAAVTQGIATPGGTDERIDLVVLRKDWALQTVRITTIAGTPAAVGTAVAPAPVQVDQTTWDLPLWEVRIINTTGAIIHYRDRRVFVGQYEPAGYLTREETYLEDEFFMPNVGIVDGDTFKSFTYQISAGAGNVIAILDEAGFGSGGISLAHGASNGDTIAIASTRFRPDLIDGKLLMILKEPNFADVNLDRMAGWTSALNDFTPPDGTFFYNDRSVDANWHARSRAGGVHTDTDTGIGLSNTWKDMEVRVRSGVAEYLIDGVFVATHFTNVPADTGQFLTVGIFDNGVNPVSQAYQHLDTIRVRGSRAA